MCNDVFDVFLEHSESLQTNAARGTRCDGAREEDVEAIKRAMNAKLHRSGGPSLMLVSSPLEPPDLSPVRHHDPPELRNS